MFESIKELPKENQAELYNAIFEYSLDFVEPTLSGLSLTIWRLIRPVLEKGNTNYINGSKPKYKQTISESEAKVKRIESEVEAYKDKDKDKYKDEDNDKDKNKKDKEPKSISDFVKLIESEKYLGTDVILNTTFINYIQMRINMKKTPTKNSIELLTKKLKEISKANKDVAIKILENSIENNWIGIFELKTNNSNNNVKSVPVVFNRSSQGQHYVGDDVK
jgi:hypothetical protein